jgi:L-2-hydroxyglutarate oxidase
VATTDAELPRLQMIYERGQANGVPCELIEQDRLRELEPHANALRGIHSSSTGIVDYKEVVAALGGELGAGGVAVQTGARVMQIARTRDGLVVVTPRLTVRTKHLVNCAGLHSDRVARLAGATPDVKVIPFRGEYYMIRPERRHLVRTLIYPVPDPEFPFLGVHLTNTIHGELEAGPNAVFALAREGYGWDRVNFEDLGETLRYSGFWAMARRYWKMGGFEMYRSLSKTAFVRALQRLVPDLQADDLETGGSGVRAQAVSADGSLVDDFRIVTERDAIHVLNAPSPGATASLAIGRHIASLAAETFAVK